MDNIAEHLISKSLKIVRIGHPARVGEKVIPHCLDVILKDQHDIVEKIEANIRNMRIKLESCSFTANTKQLTQLEIEMKKEMKQLKTQKAKLKQSSRAELSKAAVVLGTLTGCGTRGPISLLPENHFQLTVIDECSQALEMACWIVIPRSTKLVLAGDHHQLPPTVHDKRNERELTFTLMERLLRMREKPFVKMLTVQYRMNSLIMRWSSTTFYQGKLSAAPLVADHKLSDLHNVVRCELTDTILMMIDTAGRNMQEAKSANKVAPSFANLGEAAIVVDHVKSLVEKGVRPQDIGVVTPYALQVKKINN